MPAHMPLASCRMPHSACCLPLAACHMHRHWLMFNEMFGTFLENLHCTATRGQWQQQQHHHHHTKRTPAVQFRKKLPKKKKTVHKMARSSARLGHGLGWRWSHSFAREQGNRIFAAGKRDCQVFEYQAHSCPAAAAPLLRPMRCHCMSLKIWRTGARIMHEVVIIRAN